MLHVDLEPTRRDLEQKPAKEGSVEARPLLAFRDHKDTRGSSLGEEHGDWIIYSAHSAMNITLSSLACYLDMGPEIAIIFSL